MIRFIAALAFLLLPALASAQLTCPSNNPNSLPCMNQATGLQMNDILFGTQATGPDRANETVKVPVLMLIEMDHSLSPVTVGATTHTLATWLAGGSPVISVAGRTGAVLLTHADLTDWSSATAGFLSATGNGSGLTGLTFSQISGLGTAAEANIGTSGGAVPELDAPATISSPWALSITALPVVGTTPPVVTLNGSNNHYFVQLTSACAGSPGCTLANPSTTLVPGTDGEIEVWQPASGGPALISTYGSLYEYPGGTSTIAFSTAANAKDLVGYHVAHDGTIWITGVALGFVH